MEEKEEHIFHKGNLSWVCIDRRNGTEWTVPIWVIQQAKKEVFDDIENKVNLWDTDDIRGSSETKSGDKWLAISIVKQLKKRHLSKGK